MIKDQPTNRKEKRFVIVNFINKALNDNVYNKMLKHGVMSKLHFCD